MSLWRLARIAIMAAMLLGLADNKGHAEGAELGQRTRALSPDGLRQVAMMALEAGKPAIARDAAQALLARDPQDLRAALILSQAQRDLGAYGAAVRTARRVWQQADDDGLKMGAAFAAAQAQSSAGHRTIAQFWLRRAVQVAPTPRARATAIRDFQYVRARNPWSLTLDVGVTPSSNINGGTDVDKIWVYGLPFTLSGDTQALSGYETHAALSAQRTVAESKDHLYRLGMNLVGKTYQLSSEARDQAPTARGSDYAFWASEVFLNGRIRAGRGTDEWDLRFVLGHNDYGGAALSNYGSLGVGRGFDFGKDRSLHLGGYIERQWRLDSDDRSAVLRFANGAWSQKMGPGTASLSLTFGDVDSDARDVKHIRKGVTLAYDFQKPILGAGLGVSLGYERRDYGRVSSLLGEDRTDKTLAVGVEALLRDRQFMGFAPELDLSYKNTDSNWALGSSNNLSLSLRIKSTF